MSKHILSYMVGLAVICGLIAGHWFGIEEAANISVGLLWIIIIATLFLSLVPAKELYKKSQDWHMAIISIISLITWVILLAIGSFVTGFFYFLSWLIIISKYGASQDEDKAVTND